MYFSTFSKFILVQGIQSVHGNPHHYCHNYPHYHHLHQISQPSCESCNYASYHPWALAKLQDKLPQGVWHLQWNLAPCSILQQILHSYPVFHSEIAAKKLSPHFRIVPRICFVIKAFQLCSILLHSLVIFLSPL